MRELEPYCMVCPNHCPVDALGCPNGAVYAQAYYIMMTQREGKQLIQDGAPKLIPPGQA